MNKHFVKTDAKIYIDGKEVENFSVADAPIIASDEANSKECNGLYDSFTGTITLSRKQSKRLLKAFKRAERKWLWKQLLKTFKKDGF
jgi:hypothetical protein